MTDVLVGQVIRVWCVGVKLLDHFPSSEIGCFVVSCLLLRDNTRTKENTYMSVGNERLKTKTEGCSRLTYTRLCGGLGNLKIETLLRGEGFENVMGECVI